MRIVSNGADEWVRTDRNGIFKTLHAFDEQPFVIYMHDERNAPATARRYYGAGAGRTELIVPVSIGPTYSLRIQTPRACEAADLRAVVMSKWSLKQFVREEELETAVRIREGYPLWVRLPHRLLSASEPQQLLVFSTDEPPLIGVAPIPPTDELCDALDLSLQFGAGLEGRVIDSLGRPVKADIAVASVSGGVEQMCAGWQTGEEGLFDVVAMWPGEYRVSATNGRYAECVIDVTAPAAERVSVDCQLQLLGTGGSISGEVLTRSSWTPQKTYARIKSACGSRTIVQPIEHWQKAGHEGLRGVFMFNDVPSGVYELSLVSTEPYYPSEPESVIVSPPRESVAFVIRDDTPSAYYEMNIVEKGSEKVIREVTVTTQYEAFPPVQSTFQEVRNCTLGRFPLAGVLSWRVEAPGYVTRYGDRSSFRDAGGFRRGYAKRIAQIELSAGWSGEFHIHSVDGGVVVGARIILDDVEVGMTNGEGRVTVELASQPTRMNVRCVGWSIVEPPELAGVLVPPDDQGVHHIMMKPAAKARQ